MAEIVGPRKVKSWDEYFIDVAFMVATRSKDPSTQVGAVLVRDRRIVSTGYNGLPFGYSDTDPANWERPRKYEIIIHAERNALDPFNETICYDYRRLMKLPKYTLYCTLCPCDECAKEIVFWHPDRVVYAQDDNPRFVESFAKAKELLHSNNIICEKLHVVE